MHHYNEDVHNSFVFYSKLSLIYKQNKDTADLTRQFQPWVDSRVLDHRRGMAAIIHVHLRTLGPPMDDSQAQTQPLCVRLGPEMKPTGEGEIHGKEDPSMAFSSLH